MVIVDALPQQQYPGFALYAPSIRPARRRNDHLWLAVNVRKRFDTLRIYVLGNLCVCNLLLMLLMKRMYLLLFLNATSRKGYKLTT